MSEKIKPCPFASVDNTGLYHDLRIAVLDTEDYPAVVCSCGAAGATGATPDEAIAAWNCRPREDRLVNLLREARGRLLQKTALTDDGGIAFLADVDAALKEET